jgi:acetyltransferase-like isoleucine patch superfamily enzyme
MKKFLRAFLPPIIWTTLAYLKRVITRRDRNSKISLHSGKYITGNMDIRIPGGTITVGHDSLIQGLLVTETSNSIIFVGNNVFIGGGTIIDCVNSITIEDDVLVSYSCIISDSNNHSISYSKRRRDLADWRNGHFDWSIPKTASVKILKGAWHRCRGYHT